MPTNCAIPTCFKTQRKHGVCFFSWPKDPLIARLWTDFVQAGRPWKWEGPFKASVLCSDHFTKGSFEPQCSVSVQFGYRMKLNPASVPTIYPEEFSVLTKSNTTNKACETRDKQNTVLSDFNPQTGICKKKNKQSTKPQKDKVKTCSAQPISIAIPQSSGGSPSTAVPVHLYKVNQAETNQNPREGSNVVIKTEREAEDVTTNVKENESETNGLPSSPYKTPPPTATGDAQSLLGNKTVLLTKIKTEPVDYEDTTPVNSAVSETNVGGARPREVPHPSIQSVTSGGITQPAGESQLQQSSNPGEVEHVSLQPGTKNVLRPAFPFQMRNRPDLMPISESQKIDKTVENVYNAVQKADKAVQTAMEFSHAVTDTSDCPETGIDPSRLIILDPGRVIVLDPSQVSGLHPSRIPGFNPAEVPGFDPSRIPGYDPSQEYRAVYVNWKEQFKGDTVEAMDETLTQSSQQTAEELHVSGLQEALCPSDHVSKTIDDIVRFTEFIQDARDDVQIAVDFLKTSSCTCRTKMSAFVLTLEKILDLGNNNVLHMIKQLIASTKHQQTQFLHLAELVQKLKREQEDMEEKLLKYRKHTIATKRKYTTIYEPKDIHFIESECNADSRNQNQNVEPNVMLKKKNDFRCNNNKKRKFEKDQASLGKLSIFKRWKLCDLNSRNQRNKQKGRFRLDTVKFLEEMSHVKEKRVTMSLIRGNSELCQKYTGFSNYVQLKDVFNKIVADPNFMVTSLDTDKYCKQSLESEFLMTLVKIKMMVPLCYLCSQYKVSRSVIRDTLVKWTVALERVLRKGESDSEFNSLQPLLTITRRALNRIQGSDSDKVTTETVQEIS